MPRLDAQPGRFCQKQSLNDSKGTIHSQPENGLNDSVTSAIEQGIPNIVPLFRSRLSSAYYAIAALGETLSPNSNIYVKLQLKILENDKKNILKTIIPIY